MKKQLFKHIGGDNVFRLPGSILINNDCRSVLSEFPDNSVDAIITSPPYGALKDYGSYKQIGQHKLSWDEYICEVYEVLCELYRIARDGSAFWLVLDNLKENNNLRALPFEITNLAGNVGWNLQDVIVWDKGRSLPWSHRGRFRNVSEFILLLSKGRVRKFDVDAVRDNSDLSSYWVKYPERYNPDGKAPADIWHFPIPVQGSWANSKIRHFCPFPPGLVERMLLITSEKGDVVLDPFAGTGTVLAVASALGRRGVGVEVNATYVQQCVAKGFNDIMSQVTSERGGEDAAAFRKIIVDLRIHKAPKALYSLICRKEVSGKQVSDRILSFVIDSVKYSFDRNVGESGKALAYVHISVIAVGEKAIRMRIEDIVDAVLYKPPLSKFGLKIKFSVRRLSEAKRILSWVDTDGWWIYRGGRFFCPHGYTRDIRTFLSQERAENGKCPPILSTRYVNVRDNS